MQEEIFDLVDMDDRVIGQAARSRVHAEGLLHRAVHILVFNAKGELFIQKRSMSKDLCPGMWSSSCAGHLDSGEDYDHAARREFAEELGIIPPPLERLFKIPACKGTGHEFVWVYRCESEGPFKLSAEEVEKGEWRSPVGLAAFMEEHAREYTLSLRTVWAAYENHCKAGR